MKTKRSLELHPEGEGDFVFPTYGGMVRLSATEDALTPFGGLVPWAAFVRRCGLLETLSASCPVVRSSPNAAPVYDVLQSYALTVLCDGDRFAHVQRLRCDPTLADLFGVEAIVSDDTIRRFFAQIEEGAGAAWMAAASEPLWGALPDPLILDWDATVQTKYGHQEGAAIGYNPHRPGRRSLHPLLAVAAGTRLVRGLPLSQWRHGQRHAVGGGDGGRAARAGRAAGVAQSRGSRLRPRADHGLARGATGAPALSFQAAAHGQRAPGAGRAARERMAGAGPARGAAGRGVGIATAGLEPGAAGDRGPAAAGSHPGRESWRIPGSHAARV